MINTTFTYDAKGNMTSGNGLSVTYTAFNKPTAITRGTASIAFDHDPEHQRFAQTSLSSVTFYIAGGGGAGRALCRLRLHRAVEQLASWS